MPKRKSITDEQPPKKPKTVSEAPELNITSHSTLPFLQKENFNWTEDDILQLLTRIEENTPKDDVFSYTTRLDKLNWENIAFKSHSVKDCQEVWTALSKQVRKFRLLRELVGDMKQLVLTQKPKEVTTHPSVPKKPWNSYIFFVEEKRPEVMRENPTLRSTDVSKLLGQMFKDLSAEQKVKYANLAKEASQEYATKLRNFYMEHPELAPKEKKKKRAKPDKEEGPFEKPKTPFELFVHVESEKDGTNTSRVDIIDKCKNLWGQFTDKEKFFWINWADELYMKHLEDLKEYIKEHPDFNPGAAKPVLTKKEKQIKERCSGKPEKPPHAAYHLFCKMILESPEVRNIQSKQLMNYVSEKWKSCSEEEKTEYKIRVEQMWEEYDKKLEDYVMTLPPEDRDKVREKEGRKKSKPEKVKTVKEKPKVTMTKPEPPPSCPYKYFLKEYKGEENPKSVWQKMTEDEMQIYEKNLEKERREYIVQYEKYLKTLSKEELEKLGTTLTNQYESESESDSVASSEED